MLEREIFSEVWVDGTNCVCVLAIYFRHPVPRLDDISQSWYALHLEMLGLQKSVDPLTIENGSNLGWFLDCEKSRQEAAILGQ